MNKIDDFFTLSINFDKKFNAFAVLNSNSVDYISSVVGSDFSEYIDAYSNELRHSTINFFENICALCIKNNIKLNEDN